jgi:hypothetical protein
MIKERKIKTSFENREITNLKEIMKRVGREYKTEIPIYSKENDRLLLAQGKSVSQERFEIMERELRKANLKDKPSPYYTSIRTDFSQN